jgi:ubiquinone/menaquinone biosynthesis C-methylase UbiE
MKINLNLRARVALGLIFAFLANTLGPIPASQAQEFRLPAPGVMVALSPAFDPPILKGMKVDPANPLHFDFILDPGTSTVIPANPHQKRSGAGAGIQKLIKYFLASLTIPEKDLWVNLSPYEKDRIVPQSFGLTEMGRDLLAEDYILKQITASLIYPEGEAGKKFWAKVYSEAARKFGTTNIPMNTFNKVWIVPEKAVVYENAKAGTAYVVESKLKVMLEQDYLSLRKHGQTLSSLGSEIIRQIIIPELTKEVNTGRNFAQLRQVYNSLILATWYKKKIKDSILAQVYEDRNKVAGILSSPNAFVGDPEHIYQQYLQAFKKGVYNYIKEEQDPITQQTIPRKYFSGGLDMAMTSSHYGLKAAFETTNDPAQILENGPPSHLLLVKADLAMAKQVDFPTGEHYLEGVYPDAFLKELQAMSDKKSKPLVVDLGFGTGIIASWLYHQGIHIIGYDINPKNVLKAQQLIGLRSDASFMEHDISQGIPLPDNSADGIVIYRMFSQIGDKDARKRVLHELYRVLRPGGVVSFLDFVQPEVSDDYKQLYDKTYAVSRQIIRSGTFKELEPFQYILKQNDIQPLLVLRDPLHPGLTPRLDLVESAQEAIQRIEEGKWEIWFVGIHEKIHSLREQFMEEGFTIISDLKAPYLGMSGVKTYLRGLLLRKELNKTIIKALKKDTQDNSKVFTKNLTLVVDKISLANALNDREVAQLPLKDVSPKSIVSFSKKSTSISYSIRTHEGNQLLAYIIVTPRNDRFLGEEAGDLVVSAFSESPLFKDLSEPLLEAVIREGKRKGFYRILVNSERIIDLYDEKNKDKIRRDRLLGILKKMYAQGDRVKLTGVNEEIRKAGYGPIMNDIIFDKRLYGVVKLNKGILLKRIARLRRDIILDILKTLSEGEKIKLEDLVDLLVNTGYIDVTNNMIASDIALDARLRPWQVEFSYIVRKESIEGPADSAMTSISDNINLLAKTLTHQSHVDRRTIRRLDTDILLLGNDNLETFRFALKLFASGVGKRIVIGGGHGRLTEPLKRNAEAADFTLPPDKDASEAKIISSIMRQMINKERQFNLLRDMKDSDVFTLEEASSNTRENFEYYKPLWSPYKPRNLIIITTPHQQLRSKGSFNLIFKDEIKEGKIRGLSLTVPYNVDRDPYQIATELIGEAWRLIVYSLSNELDLSPEFPGGFYGIPKQFWVQAGRLFGALPQEKQTELARNLLSLKPHIVDKFNSLEPSINLFMDKIKNADSAMLNEFNVKIVSHENSLKEDELLALPHSGIFYKTIVAQSQQAASTSFTARTVDGKLIGYILAVPQDLHFLGEEAGNLILWTSSVNSKYRGLFLPLINALVEEASRKGYHKLLINLDQNIPVSEFYSALKSKAKLEKGKYVIPLGEQRDNKVQRDNLFKVLNEIPDDKKITMGTIVSQYMKSGYGRLSEHRLMALIFSDKRIYGMIRLRRSLGKFIDSSRRDRIFEILNATPREHMSQRHLMRQLIDEGYAEMTSKLLDKDMTLDKRLRPWHEIIFPIYRTSSDLDNAMAAHRNGGIDFTSVSPKNASSDDIKFHLDPAQLIQLQKSTGFVPVITSIQPLENLSTFLGILPSK